MAKNNLEIMEEIRQIRNAELKELNRNDISVTAVEFLGKGKKSKEDIFRLYEKQEFKDKPTRNLRRYYMYDGEKIDLKAVEDLDREEGIIPVGIDGDENKNWDIEREDIEKCIEDRAIQMKAIAKELGIKEEDIENLSEIDLAQKIEQEAENEQDGKDEPVELDKEQVKKINDGRNEISLNTQIDVKGTQLGDLLHLDGKLIVVHSSELSKISGGKAVRGGTTLAFVLQKPDGSYETVPETKLRPYGGQNRDVISVDGEEDIQKNSERNMFEIPGSTHKLIINDGWNNPEGKPRIFLSNTSRDNEGNVAGRLIDKYSGTYRDESEIEMQQLLYTGMGREQARAMYKEGNEGHFEKGCDDVEMEDIDGRLDTGTHTHSEVSEMVEENEITEDTVLMYEGKPMKIKEIADLGRFKISSKEFIELYKSHLGDEKEINDEEIYDEIEEDVNEQYMNGPQRG